MIGNAYKIPNIDTDSRGRNLYSNPDVLNRRCSSAHIRHFDQSESFDSFDRRPVGFYFQFYLNKNFTISPIDVFQIVITRSSQLLRWFTAIVRTSSITKWNDSSASSKWYQVGKLYWLSPLPRWKLIFGSMFHCKFRVYLTLDKSVRVTNSRHNITISLSSNGCSAAMIHPNGKVYQYGSLVEIVAYDGNETNDFVYV